MKLNPINVLFLDFDGVINNTKEFETRIQVMIGNQKHFDCYTPSLCENVNTLIQTLNLKVVISSAWRKTFDLITLRRIIKDQFKIDCEVLDCTTSFCLDKEYKERLEWEGKTERRERGLQISHWLAERKYTVKNYLVLDDSLDAGYGHENFFIRTDLDSGFTSEILENTLERFKEFNI